MNPCRWYRDARWAGPDNVDTPPVPDRNQTCLLLPYVGVQVFKGRPAAGIACVSNNSSV